ncbi:F-box domain containing protein [Heracleum sosnowskyi]|uniref:F-box domain containing protein n=1 Tax=Heracleum sosnowskyi TaxID=360622 RepID=A0AAD8N6F0_9APIA|nr:F-box domain containing protein [Heracleum sosnowskyi]
MKKLKTWSSSSQEIVLNEDGLLTLILLRVPFTQLIVLKSVSQQWLSLITSPYFTQLLRNSLPPLRASALFIQRIFHRPLSRTARNEVSFIPLDNPNAISPFRNSTFAAHELYTPQHILIKQSCNGLLLCTSSRFIIFEDRNCYVYNPSTNHLDTLPKQPLLYGIGGMYIGLAFDPSKSLHYKVLAYVTTDNSTPGNNFHIYSSETGTWKASIQSFHRPLGLSFNKSGVYLNGCLHWLSILWDSHKDTPDSSVSDCWYFNVDEERFGTFPRPPIGARRTSMRSFYFGESEGHLHVTEVCQYATSLSMYEMKSDYSGWFVKYRIDLAPIAKVFPEMTKHRSLFYDKTDYAVAVLSLVRRENFREDSFLVLEIPGKAIRYNLVDGSFKLIWDFGVTWNLKKIDHWVLGDFQVCPYVEPVLSAELQHAAGRGARSSA